MPKATRFDPLAEREVLGAARFYRDINPDAPARLFAAIDAALAKAAAIPKACAQAEIPPAQQVRLRRFPFRLIFIELETRLQVIALAHDRRRPGYWRRRVSKASP